MARNYARALMRLLLTFVLPSLIPVPEANPCSRVLWNDNGRAVVVGRTMDWVGSTEPVLTVLPRGMRRDGALLGRERVVEENGLVWTSRYGSVVTTMYGLGAADGLNERGLAAHLHFFSPADFGARDPARPGLQAGLWAQYVLDQAATVGEALAWLDAVQLVMVTARGSRSALCLALEDAEGDSAIVEYIGGRKVVHHGREFKVMTNDPPYAEQLALLKAADFTKPGNPAGGMGSTDRFLRAAYYMSKLPRPADAREAVQALLAVARNVSVPFGTELAGGGAYQTEYRTLSDLTHRRYYFDLVLGPGMIWADLARLDLSPGAPVRVLRPTDATPLGDSVALFKPAPAPF